MAEKIEELKQQLAEAQAKAEKFERLHADGLIEHELRKAAEEGKAFNADQIIALLKGKSRLVEVGGKHVVRVVTLGDDGKEIHHSPAQAVGHMKQNKDNHNFFRDTMAATSTLAQPSGANLGKTDLEKLLKDMPMEQYIKLRAEKPEMFGLDPLPKRR